MAIVVLFIVGLTVGFAILTYWKHILIVLGAVVFAVVFAGVLKVLAVVGMLHGGAN